MKAFVSPSPIRLKTVPFNKYIYSPTITCTNRIILKRFSTTSCATLSSNPPPPSSDQTPLLHNNSGAAQAASSSSHFDMSQFEAFLYDSQAHICSQLEQLENSTNSAAKFCVDDWAHDTGHGRTRVLQSGTIFEKAGVNISSVSGTLSPERARAMTSRGRVGVEAGKPYQAMALSLVLHTQSPFVPTLRGDVRVFSVAGPGEEGSSSIVWGGGGTDLTMYYVDRPAFTAFHKQWRDLLHSNDVYMYESMKEQCDAYFYLPSRQEHRGVGGIFYDDVEGHHLPNSMSLFEFQKLVLDNMVPIFVRDVLQPNIHREYSAEQKRWQRIRRGRYLEFNLLNDRGVRFGLGSAPAWRTDSIMISAPPSIEFPYGYTPDPASPEEQAVQLLRSTPIDWADL